MDDRVNTCRCERCCPDNPDPALTRAHQIACLGRWIVAQWKSRHLGFASRRAAMDAMKRRWPDEYDRIAEAVASAWSLR